VKISLREFFLHYEGARRDDERWPQLDRRGFMEAHWAIDDYGCYYMSLGQEPEQPQWPPCIEPAWSYLYGKVDGFVEQVKWVMQ